MPKQLLSFLIESNLYLCAKTTHALNYRRLFILSAAIYLTTSIFSIGHHHPDEHFQILEFAALKLGLAQEADLAWEYHYQMRPALQPAFVVALYRLLALFGRPNPFFVAFVLRLLSAALSLYVIHRMIRLYAARYRSDRIRRWFAVLSFLLWFTVYNNVRFSSENWSGSLFALGFVMLLERAHPKLIRYLGAGALFGLAFVIRYQVAFMILGLGLWLWWRRGDRFGRLVAMALAFFAMVGTGILIDRWFYGDWVLTMWNYLKLNLIEGRASGFGTSPWYYYVTETIKNAVPPFSLLYVAAFLWMFVKHPKSALTWTVLPFVAVHSLIAHKELRFMFPVLPFLPVAIAYLLDDLATRYGEARFLSHPGFRFSRQLFWFANIVPLIGVMFLPANPDVPRIRALYRAIHKPAIIYYSKLQPYGDFLPRKFYYPPYPVRLVPIETVRSIEPVPGHQIFIILNDDTQTDAYLRKGGRLIYNSYPRFTRKFNIGGWVDRIDWDTVVELFPDD